MAKAIEGLFLFSITLLLIYDYFPDMSLQETFPSSILLLLMFGTVVASFLFKRLREYTVKELFRSQLFMIVYLLFLLAVLKLAGGESTLGISLSNLGVQVIVIMSLLQLVVLWKKLKKEREFQ
ncbi:hypothetical protein IQ283_13325 [Alkalihalobacillus hwajinpoensis]|uniref:hypothetical protein n=1 Tax=Guptibacillus hwajinpoensis TaxID=208199 RepID=UPI00188457D1|nr:hypothetical protein [Pseudalkalibacillus hwajinpoensis]MBF0707572.1 hypothetical protein [Pseudalkalibacillus hwajinpoensis]